MEWSAIMLDRLRAGGVRLVTYVPDKVLIPLIAAAHEEPTFTTFAATREEEAIGIAAGAALGGMPGAVLMQSSGFGNSVNALSSLIAPYQLPMLLVISERGVLGEFNAVQVPIVRTIRPVLDLLGIPHVTLTRLDEVAFITERTLAQAQRTQTAAALILSPLLTGGKDEG
jgi:sulfopyruvate decarboxylase alpha subunit